MQACARPCFATGLINKNITKEGEPMVVELENMKQEIRSYEQPLVEVRDSL
jgi:hypothetical protein